MALVAAGWEMVVSFIDRGSNTTTRTYPFVAAIDTHAEVLTEAAAILAVIPTVSGLSISGYSLRQKYEENALAIPTVSNAEVSSHAEISGLLEGYATKRATVDIPGPLDAIFVATTGKNYNVVNMNSGEPAADYAALFSSTANCTVSDGEQFAQPEPDWVGKRTHSKSRNG